MRALALLVLVGCGGPDEPAVVDSDPVVAETDAPGGPLLTFTAHQVDAAATGVRHAVLVDLDGDGALEIVASLSGVVTEADVPPGRVVVYDSDGTLDGWTRTEVLPESAGVRQPNEPLAHDVDRDGDLDLIVPHGSPFCDPLPQVESCGGISWLRNDGGAWTRRPILDGLLTIHHAVALADIDDDGILDLVTSGEDLSIGGTLSVTVWIQGTGTADGFRDMPSPIGPGGGPWPTIHDVDGDGDDDVVMGERNGLSTFFWFEAVQRPTPDHPAGTWARHTIDDRNGQGWMIRFVPDLIGDGLTYAVGTNHTNTVRQNDPDPEPSAVFVYLPGADPREPWTATPITTGIEAVQDVAVFPMEAPGVFQAGDIDLDGDLDLALAGDGDPAFYLLEQSSPGAFETRILRDGIPRNGGAAVGDLDGDGDPEVVVTAQLHNAVFVIEAVHP